MKFPLQQQSTAGERLENEGQEDELKGLANGICVPLRPFSSPSSLLKTKNKQQNKKLSPFLVFFFCLSNRPHRATPLRRRPTRDRGQHLLVPPCAGAGTLRGTGLQNVPRGVWLATLGVHVERGRWLAANGAPVVHAETTGSDHVERTAVENVAARGRGCSAKHLAAAVAHVAQPL